MSLETPSDNIKNTEAVASLASPDVVSSKDEGGLKGKEQVVDKTASELAAPISPPVPSPSIEENGDVNGVDKMEVDEEEKEEEEKEEEKEEKEEKEDEANGEKEDIEKEESEKEESEKEDAEMKDAEKEDAESKDAEQEDAENKDAETKDAAEPKDAAESKETESKDEDVHDADDTTSAKHDRPDDSETNGSSKKLKTENGEAAVDVKEDVPVPVATPTSKVESRDYSNLDPDEPSDALPKHQLKFALSVVRSVKRLKDAAPFTAPVDPVKLGIPTYLDFVKKPMDLGTIEKKLSNNEYTSVSAFVEDFDLIVSNCVLFNGEESVISVMARNLATSFHKHMTNMPKYDSQITGPLKAKKKSSIIPISSSPTPKPQRAAAVAANAANISSSKDDFDPLSTSPGATATTSTTTTSKRASISGEGRPFALQPGGIPTIRRESAIEGGRPKREIHPPKSKDLPYGDIKPRRKKFAAELKFCGQALKELFSKKHEAYSFPFLQPVDPVALNCPSYFKVIKEPMDLSTVQDKYNKNEYENADDFERDVRLIFKNCYKFNPEGSPVNVMGRKLEALFDKKWQEKPVPAPTPPIYSSDDEFSDYDEDFNESKVTNPAIEFLEEQLERIKSQLATLRKEAVREAREARRSSIAAKKRRKSGKAGGAGDKRKSNAGIRRASASGLNAPPHITYEMKKELSEKIGTLSEKKLRHVVGIIEESMPQLKDSAQDEIELDMDQLNSSTLMRLYNFVVRRDERKPKPPRAPATAGSSSSSRKKKNKPLSEAEQSRQLEELQKKIKQFDRMKDGSSDGDSSSDGGNNNNNNNNNSVMSSDDSSSEEE